MNWLAKGKGCFTYFILLSALLFMVGLAFINLKTRDQHPRYWVNLNYKSNQDRSISAGFSALKITPQVEDEWTDANGDAQYKPEDGDTYTDKNGNGVFDPVWIAGFQNQRPAQGVHDDLWARTMILSDGNFTFSFTVLDLIGFSGDDVIRVRNMVKDQVPVDYSIIASTHTHEGPDVLGLWGESERKSGINPEYLSEVISISSQSIIEAYQNLEPAKISFAQDLNGASHLVMDSRKPIIIDPAIRIMKVSSANEERTLGTIINWSNHPETTWDKNLLISSDFPHYIREGMENGITIRDSIVEEGLGGVSIFANGSIGGLMTTKPDFGIPDLQTGELIYEPDFPKAEAQGMAVALLALQALENSSAPIQTAKLQVRARSLKIPMKNRLYKLALLIGVLDRGLFDWWELRSEVAYWKLGPAEFLHHPAEIYPEIVIGGIEKPLGADYKVDSLETPPLESLLHSEYKFFIGLSNDMIGYVIPKSEWDEKAPFIYEYEKSPYGEMNSLGPQTAPILHKAIIDLVK